MNDLAAASSKTEGVASSRGAVSASGGSKVFKMRALPGVSGAANSNDNRSDFLVGFESCIQRNENGNMINSNYISAVCRHRVLIVLQKAAYKRSFCDSELVKQFLSRPPFQSRRSHNRRLKVLA